MGSLDEMIDVICLSNVFYQQRMEEEKYLQGKNQEALAPLVAFHPVGAFVLTDFVLLDSEKR